jgi:hypothetical protein
MRQTPVLAVLPVLVLLALPGPAPAQGRAYEAQAACAAELAAIGQAAFVQRYADDEVQDATRRCVARYRQHHRRSDRGHGGDADQRRRQGADRAGSQGDRAGSRRGNDADQRRSQGDDRPSRGRADATDHGRREGDGHDQRPRQSARRGEGARNAD